MTLSGCLYGSPLAQELSDLLVDMHDAEKEYRTSNKKLNEIEKSEQVIFDEAMELTQEDVDLETKVEEMEKLLGQRLELIEKEKASMELAASFIPKIEDLSIDEQEKMKKDIKRIVELVKHRYELHAVFIKEYKQLCELQENLYRMLLEVEIEYKQLQEQVISINAQNDIVHDAIEKFNEATIEMNNWKEEVFETLKGENE